jgi:2-hydroxy-3-oxopropionate reductase
MRIGFCGTGFMGAPMARRLLAAGHEVHVWNRTPDKCAPLVAAGAVMAASPLEVATQCDVVCLCLLDGPAVEAVVFGRDGLAQAGSVRLIVDHSSIPPDRTQSFAQRLQHACGAQWVDAPVSGGVPGAEAGSLAIMAGGSADAVDELRPLLAAYASRVTHMGPCGSGQVAKLCNQIIVAAGVLAVAEAIGLAECSGIDAQRLPEALGGGLADSRLLQIFAARMLHPSAAKTGALTTMLKDIDAVTCHGSRTQAALPITATVRELMRQALLGSAPGMDLWEIVRLYRPLDRDASVCPTCPKQ